MRKRGAFAATALGLAAVMIACASKVAAPTPYRFTSLDPTLRVDELQGDQLEQLAVDGATLQQSCYDDALRRFCLFRTVGGGNDLGTDACFNVFADCLKDPPQLDGGTFFALTRGAAIHTSQCAMTVGELATCILDQQRAVHEWLSNPCASTATNASPVATVASCSAVASNTFCAYLVSELVPDLCATPLACSY